MQVFSSQRWETIFSMPLLPNIEKMTFGFHGEYGYIPTEGVTLRLWELLAHKTPNLKSLTMVNYRLCELEYLAELFPELEELVLQGCYKNRGDELYEGLDTFKKLKSLDLRHNSIFSHNSEPMRGDKYDHSFIFKIPSLEVLKIGNPEALMVPVPDYEPWPNIFVPETFFTSGELPNLSSLDLSHLFLPTLDFSYLAPNLTQLVLDGAHLSQDSLQLLGSLPLLEKLDLSNTDLSLSDFQMLFKLTQLKELKIKNMKNRAITNKLIHKLEQNLPQCHISH
jgi:Leucine-rich repeat (LRR) protein